MPGPGYLIVALKITNRDSSYIDNALRGPGTTLTTSTKREARRVVNGIKDLLDGAVSGVHSADLWVAVPGTNAAVNTRTITCTQANAANDTVTFACGTLSIVKTEGVDFARGASDTTCALALANALTADTVLSALYTFVPASGVITMTAKMPTNLPVDWTLATNDGTAFAFATTVVATEGTAKLAFRNVPLNHTP